MFLTHVLTFFLLTYHIGQLQAAPAAYTPSSHTTPLAWDTSIRAVMESKSQTSRTLFNVIWSCILTVFICAWTSVHPNVPPQSRMRGLIARIKLMFWTIVAPELVLAWAVRQWFSATEVRDIYNKFKGEEALTLETKVDSS